MTTQKGVLKMKGGIEKTSTSKKKLPNIDIAKLSSYLVLIVISLIMLMPFIWMVSSSFKLEEEIFRVPMEWIPRKLHFSNYSDMWNRITFFKYYQNTIIVSISVTIIQIITSSMAAYSFSKIRFRGRETLFITYLSTMMVPFTVVMIPLFIIIRKLGLYDNLLAIILMHAFSPFGVFLFRQFFMSIPDSLIEAARIDGASEFQIYRRIVMPMSKPAIGSLTIFTFIFTWNDFMGPLVFLSSNENLTLQVGMRNIMTMYGSDYALLLAAAVLGVIPTIGVFLMAQDFFIQGVAGSGMKG